MVEFGRSVVVDDDGSITAEFVLLVVLLVEGKGNGNGKDGSTGRRMD